MQKISIGTIKNLNKIGDLLVNEEMHIGLLSKAHMQHDLHTRRNEEPSLPQMLSDYIYFSFYWFALVGTVHVNGPMTACKHTALDCSHGLISIYCPAVTLTLSVATG